MSSEPQCGRLMNRFTTANLEWFFAALEPVEGVYGDPEFSFLIHSGSNGVSLLHSRLSLQPLPSAHPDRVIEVGNFYGFSGRLALLGVDPRTLVKMLLDGYVPAPDRVWRLSRDHNAHGVAPSMYRETTSRNDYQQQQVYELFGHGLSILHIKTDEDDWLLRSAETPFSSINDLLRDLRLPTGGTSQFQMIALPPIVVDVTSRVKGEVAELKLRCSKFLPHKKVRLGIVVNDKDKVVERRHIDGDQFNWSVAAESSDVLVGGVEIKVPKASVVHCLAVFDGRCYHHYWIGDPDASQNPLRTIYQVFDPDFENMVAMLSQPAHKGQATAHENAVTALLWMLGFAPIQLGRFSEAPDIIAVSSDGQFIVVECTLSDPQTKKQNKPQKLLDRATDIKAALERCDARGRVCVPVLVTSRKRADIEDDVADCERRGIVVYTQDDIEPLTLLTLMQPQSDIRFRDLRQRLDEAVESYKRSQQKAREMTENFEEMKKSLDSISRSKVGSS